MKHDIPPALHVLLAKDAPLAVVLRRGPTKMYSTWLWNRDTDEVTLGQWMKGRIYEDRCDLSSDGKFLLYFVMTPSDPLKSQPWGWTVVSRAPYLKAIVLLPQNHTWYGGGFWTSNRKYWLNGLNIKHAPEVKTDSRHVKRELDPKYAAQSLTRMRMERDGWRWVGAGDREEWQSIYERPLTAGWMLRRITHGDLTEKSQGRSPVWDEYVLFNPENHRTYETKWEWADMDRSRVVWAEKGRLCTAELTDKGLGPERTIFDFNGKKFEPIKAPYDD